MNFNIGDEIRVRATGESGVITDRMFSEGKGVFMYVVKPADGGRSIIRREDELDECHREKEYRIETEIAEGVVIGIIYEIDGDKKYEVCRGHGHIIHEGAEGIAQACSYAFKKAFAKIDNGIYFKNRAHD
jgi:hypothetical protein